MSRTASLSSISRTRTFEKGESFQEIADFIVKNIETSEIKTGELSEDISLDCPISLKYRIQIIPVREKQMMAY